MPDVVTLGETCVAFVAKTEGFLRYISEFERKPGGAESTVAAGVTRLGHSSGWISRVGDDEFGLYLLMLMRAENVDVSQVKVIEGKSTGVFFRERKSAGGARVFYYRAGSAAAGMVPEDLEESYIASAKILHLTGITPGLSPECLKTIEGAFRIAKRCNVVTTFDPNLRLKIWPSDRAKPILERFMTLSDYVLPGIEDMEKLYGTSSKKEILAYLRKIGCKKVVLKLGEEGAILALPDGEKLIPGYPVNNPVDTFGAGDAFAAGFISGLLRNMPLEEAVDLGNAVASLSIQFPGNIESLPDRVSVDLFRQNKKTIMR